MAPEFMLSPVLVELAILLSAEMLIDSPVLLMPLEPAEVLPTLIPVSQPAPTFTPVEVILAPGSVKPPTNMPFTVSVPVLLVGLKASISSAL